MTNPPLLIIEGGELTGKSFITSQLYSELEPLYNSGGKRLDGCHWFNTDVGIFGGTHAAQTIELYTQLAETISDRPIIFEKFHITDRVYQKLYNQREIEYTDIEERLLRRNALLITCSITADEELFAKRLNDRLELYPHYKRIAQAPKKYIEQQLWYEQFTQDSKLPTLKLDSTQLPNEKLISNTIKWIRENGKS